MRDKLTWLIGIVMLLDLALLIFLGKDYTKFILIEPFLYAHDLLVLVMVLLSIPYFKFTKRIESIELLFLMAIGYLIYSFTIHRSEDFQIILRQFMLFGYGICLYVIMNRIFTNATVSKNFTRYMMYFALSCVFVQILYISYLFLLVDINPFFERRYLSPIIMMGFFVAASYVLVNLQNQLLKHFIFLLIFIASFSTGHDSTYLSLVLIYISYLFVTSAKKYRMLIVALMLIGIISIFILIPSFADVNVRWRLIYWQDTFWTIANNYFVFGDGFGVPYITDDAAKRLNALFGDIPFSPEITDDKVFLTAPHNSFITMMLHLGVLSVLLLFYPLRKVFSHTIVNKEVLFLTLSLFGILVFSAFNVVLELPHASSIFWIFLFGLIFQLSELNINAANLKEG